MEYVENFIDTYVYIHAIIISLKEILELFFGLIN